MLGIIPAFSFPKNEHQVASETQRAVDEIVSRVLMPEVLQLPSTRRLFGLAQHSPVVDEVLGLNLTRGAHAEGTMRLAAHLLAHLWVAAPEYFYELIKPYTLDPKSAILHAVEYMRIHDLPTLAFQGALHGKLELDGEPYDEDLALIMALEERPTYKPVSDVINDPQTQDYYSRRGIDKTKILQIARDAIGGSNVLGLILKGGKGFAPNVDWMAYTASDLSALNQTFGIDANAPFTERISLVLTKLAELSETLSTNSPLPQLAKATIALQPIEQLVPLDIVRLGKVNGKIEPIYDARAIFELYLTHIILRLCYTGSPWMRGTYSQMLNHFVNQFGKNDPELIRLLLTKSEAEFLNSGLRGELQVKGWNYSPSPNEGKPINFVFKHIEDAKLDLGGNVVTFKDAFANLMDWAGQIKKQPPLYLIQA